jgi:hypothetical protein
MSWGPSTARDTPLVQGLHVDGADVEMTLRGPANSSPSETVVQSCQHGVKIVLCFISLLCMQLIVQDDDLALK